MRRHWDINKFIFLKTVVFLSVLSASSPQKVYLFLKQPIKSPSVVVHLKDLRKDFNGVKKHTALKSQVIHQHQVFYSKKNNKRSISIVLERSGLAQLDVYDLKGNRITRLVEAILSKGSNIFYENESWKNFIEFRGVAFFVLSLDNINVLRQLVPKVE